MVGAQTHIIRRQSIKVNAAVHDAFALKRKIELLIDDLAPKLSDMFDGLITENEWLEIDRLDINIDGIKEDELDEQLLQRILQSIRDKIDARKYNAIMVDGASGAKDIHFISVHEKTITALQYFLKNGILPWWFETTAHGNFEEQLIKAFEVFVWDGKAENLKRVLSDLGSAMQNPIAQHRLAEQFSEPVYFNIVRLLSYKFSNIAYNDVKVVLDRIFAVLNGKKGGNHRNSLPESKTYATVILQITKQIKQDLLACLAMGDGSIDIVLKNLMREVYRSLENASLVEEQRALMADVVLKFYLPDKLRSASLGSKAVTEKENVDLNSEGNIPEEKIPIKAKDTELKNGVINAEGAIIKNAGLILIAPFLTQLFNQCGILEHNEIKDISKAIAILHYIVFKNCDYREYDVLFNKVLCGVDDNQPITLLEELSEQDKNEIEEMLSTAISYWTVLKNTSPDGLREGFLVRKGNLHHKYEDWFLHVEQSAIDALLQQLPWTIGFIKLPWMKKMIRTQWI